MNCEDNKDLCKEHGVSSYPTLKWFGKGSGEAELYSGGRDLDSFIEFISKNTGVRVAKPSSSVVVLTPENFDKIVMDKTKDVLVKSLAPIYDKIAHDFANEPNVVIAKIDADEHKSIKDKVDFSGFPTLKFFPRGDNKEAIDYDGGRTEEDFLEFINEKAGTNRVVGGGLGSQAGIVEEFNDIVDRFINAAGDVDLIKELATEAVGIGKRVGTKSAEYYSKTLGRVVEKGSDYIESEIKRLAKMIESSSLAPKTKDEFVVRKNILSKFIKKVKEDVEEKGVKVNEELTDFAADEL
ncbi:hypothetical protein L0F63_001292 [Massospora cicadina]|nr:hypothetical protein L0F63_001292 [Massospora cicadina]